MDCDFLIVGTGIGGSVLANLLVRSGRRVVILERDLAPVPRARPEILWPATVRFLESLLPNAVPPLAVAPLRGLVFHHQGVKIAEVSDEVFQRAGVQPWSSDADGTRAALVRECGCEVRRGLEVTSLLREGERVVGVRARSVADGCEVDLAARWIIGDDGAHSIVRRESGIGITLHSVPMDLLSFGFEWPDRLPAERGHVYFNPRRARSGLPLAAGLWRPGTTAAGLIPVRPRLFDEPGALDRALDDFRRSDPEVAEFLGTRRFPEEFTRFRLTWGHAESYGGGGVILIGDAAHPVTPAGGQGANAAIADARALAALAILDESRLVAAYESRRRPANERSLRPSRAIVPIFSLPDWLLFSAAPRFARLLRWFPGLPARGLRFVSTAFIDQPTTA